MLPDPSKLIKDDVDRTMIKKHEAGGRRVDFELSQKNGLDYIGDWMELSREQTSKAWNHKCVIHSLTWESMLTP